MHIATALLAAGSSLAAQRLDGCSPPSHNQGMLIGTVADDARDRVLANAGYSLTDGSVLSALNDARPEVRSLAALRVSAGGQQDDLAPAMRAWLTETDECTSAVMRESIRRLLMLLSNDPGQHPGHQLWVRPFQACTPTQPAVISLTIEQDPQLPTGMVRISARNLTSDTLPFLKPHTPDDLFSVTVLGPDGQRDRIRKEDHWLYEPAGRPDESSMVIVKGPAFVALPPGEDVSWVWDVGTPFDMTAPGVYEVSFGGRIPYLNATVCSNVAHVSVK